MLRNLGTKEGYGKSLENENGMIQLVAEGDDQQCKMSKGATLDMRATSLLYLNEMVDGDSLVVDLKTKGLSTRASNYNNTIVIFGHPLQPLLAQDSLRSAGIQVRLQLVYIEAEEINAMTNKTQNAFRLNKKRLSSKEKLINFHQRKCEKLSNTGREELVKKGLYGLLQVAYIYCTWYMDDRSDILQNLR